MITFGVIEVTLILAFHSWGGVGLSFRLCRCVPVRVVTGVTEQGVQLAYSVTARSSVTPSFFFFLPL